MDAATGRIVGAEALVRWLKPNGEVISPARFIDELERTALINPLTIQMLEQIPEDLKPIFTSDSEFRCSLNLVPEQVEQEDFCHHVDTLVLSPDNTPVLDAYIQMAKTLEMEVIAEGVEKQEQSLALLARGVHLHQGYYFSKPLPAEEFVHFWLSKQN